IDDSVTFEKGRHNVKVTVYNYTPKRQRFNLHTVLPEGCLDEATCKPRPAEVRAEGKISWELPYIPSTNTYEITFSLDGLDADEFDETDLYISGINPIDVMGADPLPGDWDVAGVDFTEVEAPAQAAEEEEEPDYDEEGEELEDE
ncbi:MAG: DNA topoisomerase VI subunit B, partial [Euryarchaeota archaeon]|nr:DNA topoisomerase VI subunit B [Euryarchaeota archaeon]